MSKKSKALSPTSVNLGHIIMGPLCFRIYRIELRDGKFQLHTISTDGPTALQAVPESGPVAYRVIAPDYTVLFSGFHPAEIFDEARQCGNQLADIWMIFPLQIVTEDEY